MSRLAAAQNGDLDGLTRAQAEHGRRHRLSIHDRGFPNGDDDIADDQPRPVRW
jgi:hypothetical protein